MIGRLLISIVFGFVFGTTGLVLAPDLARIAGPTLCAGEFAPDMEAGWLEFRCVSSADGRIRRIPPDRVVLHTAAIGALLALIPVSLLLGRLEARSRKGQHSMHEDLESALPARAEVLGAAAVGPPKRQILMRAAELRLTLWVQPAQGRPYEARVYWFIEQEHIRELDIGNYVSVRINPLHPERVYPAAPWAEYVWYR